MTYHAHSVRRFFFVFLSLFLAMAIECVAADGDVDLSFGTRGIVQTDIPFNASVSEMVMQEDGKIIAVGGRSAMNGGGFVIRYNPDGSIDTTFGNGGRVVNISNGLSSLVLQPDGKIVVAGSIYVGIGESLKTDFFVARLNQDGSLDTTFGNGGSVSVHVDEIDRGRSLALQPDGKIVLGGSLIRFLQSFNKYCLLRFNNNGSLDFSFGFFGRVVTGIDGDLVQIGLQPDGKILATGGSTGMVTARFNLDGSLDTGFGTGGIVTQQAARASGLALQPGGDILIVGGGDVFRYKPDGSLDTTFGTLGGHSTMPANITDVKLQGDGKILLAASAGIARLHANGLPDLPYRGLPTPGLSVNAVVIQSDGKAVIGGQVAANNQQLAMLARFGGSRTSVDFDGDGRSDPSIFRSGTWYIHASGSDDPNSFYGVPFGLAADQLTPADFDGDGKTDIAVWRENVNGPLGYFFILKSATNTVQSAQFGVNGDTTVVGDWDGDGVADVAVYREGGTPGGQSYFVYQPSSQGVVAPESFAWGRAGDEPLRGDFDGDSRMDAAVYRPSDNIWYILQSSDSQVRYVYSGVASDKRVSGDFDGDGKTDIAIYRDGIWAVLQSSNNEGLYAWWGLATDTLVPGDYDGDGRTDFAVWRDGIYYILQSSDSQFVYRYLGLSGDIPIASAFVR